MRVQSLPETTHTQCMLRISFSGLKIFLKQITISPMLKFSNGGFKEMFPHRCRGYSRGQCVFLNALCNQVLRSFDVLMLIWKIRCNASGKRAGYGLCSTWNRSEIFRTVSQGTFLKKKEKSLFAVLLRLGQTPISK